MSEGLTDSVEDMSGDLGVAFDGLASDIAQSASSIIDSVSKAGMELKSSLVSGLTGMQSKSREIWNEIKGTTGETLSSMTEAVRSNTTDRPIVKSTEEDHYNQTYSSEETLYPGSKKWVKGMALSFH